MQRTECIGFAHTSWLGLSALMIKWNPDNLHDPFWQMMTFLGETSQWIIPSYRWR